MTDTGLSAYFCFLFEEMKTSIRGLIPMRGGGGSHVILVPACWKAPISRVLLSRKRFLIAKWIAAVLYQEEEHLFFSWWDTGFLGNPARSEQSGLMLQRCGFKHIFSRKISSSQKDSSLTALGRPEENSIEHDETKLKFLVLPLHLWGNVSRNIR